MSKAFAPGESDNDAESEILKAPVLPPGVRNYITPAGEQKLLAERDRLMAERARLTDTVEGKQRRNVIDRRLEFLAERLNRAQVIDPAKQPKDRVLFGASVTVKEATGAERVWRIVGIDETDFDRGLISWMSPLARGLIDKKPGDSVTVGDQSLTIVSIA